MKKFLIIVGSIIGVAVIGLGVMFFALTKGSSGGNPPESDKTVSQEVETLEEPVSEDVGVIPEPDNPDSTVTDSPEEETTKGDATEEAKAEETLKIYIPNTSGDFIFISSQNEHMIINGGLKEEEAFVQDYLRNYLKVKNVKYVLGTNYHNDSIEGLPKILSYINTDYLLIGSNVSNHRNAKPLMEYLTKRQLIWTVPGKNATFKLGDATFQLMTTHDDGSIVLHLTHGDNEMVFTSSIMVYDDVLEDLPSDVDMLSITESGKYYTFPTHVYNVLNPKAVLFNDRVGVDPTDTLTALKTKDSKVHRLTQEHNIVVGSNGVDISIKTNVPQK